ncbi:MAG TPA: cupin domain-containing protein [Thermoanaerobaculia bacterium]
MGDIPRERFFAEHFQRAPFAQPATAHAAIPLLRWRTIETVMADGADMLVVRDAKLRREPNPTSFYDALELFRDGWSLVFRRCEKHDPALRSLADAFGRELEGDVSIQLYLTPASHHSFSWHYDCEDVFIVQTGGVKEYYLRRNTVNPEPTLDAMPHDMQYEQETSPTIASTLIPGDTLYIPRGWWHVARAVEDALSISVGVLSPAAASSQAASPPRRSASPAQSHDA